MSSSSATLTTGNQPPYKIELKAFYNCNNLALVHVEASDDATTAHIPSTVVLVIDISGSMSSPAAIHDDSDGASGLSQLDVVKHASRTILESLHEQDQLAVVAFASDAKTVFPLAPMTAENRRKAWEAVNGLCPTTQTNLYGGLIQALDLIKNQETMPSNPNILLLTDGMPNVSPPRGELKSLNDYLDANPPLRKVRIGTFGFGYSLQSQLLFDIAKAGRSLYAFIPDASFVGTVFVNAVSNILASASASPLTLSLEAAEGVTLVGCSTGQSFVKTNWGLSIDLPSLLYGQTLEVLVQTSGDPSKEPFQAFLDWEGRLENLEAIPRYVDPMDSEDSFFARAQIRSELLHCIGQAGRCVTGAHLEKAKTVVADAKHRVAELSESVELPEVAKMRDDLEGQITEAYSRLDWHKRWGGHYILSLARAHSLQQCSNFKDPGLQTYATQKFSLIRDASEAKFVELPPPKPSRQVRKQVQSMRQFHNSRNPCFASGNVHMADGSRVSITKVKAGDWLRSANGLVRVQCVVETPISAGTEGLVLLEDNVVVTPWHPVRPIGAGPEWKFPFQVAAPQWLPCRRVFSLVLEDGESSFQIGNYEAVSLGHGILGDPIAKHDYLGTELVLKDLAEMKGWASGHVVLPAEPIIRDPDTNLTVGLMSNASKPAALIV